MTRSDSKKTAKSSKKPKQVEIGTLRINSKDLKVYEKTKTKWKKTPFTFPGAIEAIKLFKAHNNFDFLKDTKDPKWLKGQSFKGKAQGARINFLPSGQKLDKAYSLFAEDLTIHDESSNDHWDVLYKAGKSYMYVYTLEKREANRLNKFHKVHEFEKRYPKIQKNAMKALKNKEDRLALPMFTLLKTYMRVGSEQHYKANGHKGLTTLKKKNISIKGNEVTFDYLAKDGVPRTIIQKFPSLYINRLRAHLRTKGRNSFVFTNSNDHPLKDTEFNKAFLAYSGKEFYPHIVRSYYATKSAQDFLKKNKKISKDEMRNFFLSVATKLGHKKFDKKHQEWQDSYNVTIKHYIQRELVEKIKERAT
jgi:hypothetical protein